MWKFQLNPIFISKIPPTSANQWIFAPQTAIAPALCQRQEPILLGAFRSACTHVAPKGEGRLRLGNAQINLAFRSACTTFAGCNQENQIINDDNEE